MIAQRDATFCGDRRFLKKGADKIILDSADPKENLCPSILSDSLGGGAVSDQERLLSGFVKV